VLAADFSQVLATERQLAVAVDWAADVMVSLA
jgi:hypothetical protein